MSALCIVPCGKRKIWDVDRGAGARPAREVYVGVFARKCREYAEAFYPSSWCILSAKHGFLWPGDIVPGPYEVSFNDRSTRPVGVAELRGQVAAKGLDGFTEVVALGGRRYTEIACEVFAASAVRLPLEGCPGIGHMMRRLNQALAAGMPL